jgi:L-threonylcarbamoyladenylate synthase
MTLKKKMAQITLLLAMQHLFKSEIVAIPTETVYGLAGNAYSEKAIKRFRIKKRPFIIHLLFISSRSLIKLPLIPEKQNY